MTHEQLLAEVATWPADRREDFEERAGIAEYHGRLSRQAAEVLAWQRCREVRGA